MSEQDNLDTSKSKKMKRIREPKRKQRIEEGYSRHYFSEKTVSNNLLGDFNVETSEGKKLIEEIFGKELKEIKSHSIFRIAKLVSELIDIQLPRNIYRRKDLMVKWFDTYHEQIEGYKNHIFIEQS